MNVETATARPDGIERLARDLPSFSATKLASGMQAVTHTMMARGALVITRHRQSMVLMSVEHHLRMEQASEPDLRARTYVSMTCSHACRARRLRRPWPVPLR